MQTASSQWKAAKATPSEFPFLKDPDRIYIDPRFEARAAKIKKLKSHFTPLASISVCSEGQVLQSCAECNLQLSEPLRIIGSSLNFRASVNKGLS